MSFKLKLILGMCSIMLSTNLWAQEAVQKEDAIDSILKGISQPVKAGKERLDTIVNSSFKYLGIPYKFGGNSPETGFDCSGFVKRVFKETIGLALPRRAAEMSQQGESVAQDDLKPGDLVFYKTSGNTVSHVGIYVGDRKFVHAPSAGGVVRVESMDIAYWKKRFSGARRLISDTYQAITSK